MRRAATITIASSLTLIVATGCIPAPSINQPEPPPETNPGPQSWENRPGVEAVEDDSTLDPELETAFDEAAAQENTATSAEDAAKQAADIILEAGGRDEQRIRQAAAAAAHLYSPEFIDHQKQVFASEATVTHAASFAQHGEVVDQSPDSTDVTHVSDEGDHTQVWVRATWTDAQQACGTVADHELDLFFSVEDDEAGTPHITAYQHAPGCDCGLCTA